MPTLVDASEVLAELGITSPTANETSVVTAAMVKAASVVKKHLRYDPVQLQRTEFYPQRRLQSPPGESVWEVNDSVAYIREVSDFATDELQLQHIPIRSIQYLYIDSEGRGGSTPGGFADSTLKTEGTDFWPNYDLIDSAGAKVCRDGILRSIGLWTITPGSVKVVYTAGYNQAELRGTDSIIDASPIWEAVLNETVRRVRRVLATQKGSIGLPVGVLASENLGDYSYSLDSSAAGRLFGGPLSADSVQLLGEFVNIGFDV